MKEDMDVEKIISTLKEKCQMVTPKQAFSAWTGPTGAGMVRILPSDILTLIKAYEDLKEKVNA